MYEKRSYRESFSGSNLVFFDAVAMETDLKIGADKDLGELAYKWIIEYRKQLEDYIRSQPMFLSSLEPVIPKSPCPYIVKRMCEAGKKAGVGPMAAVAGAFSELVGLKLLEGSKEVIIENGGDLFIKSDSIRKIGIYAGKSPLSWKIAMEIRPEKTPIGVCTSSGTVGHSLSFGRADAAVIVSKDTFLADAVATATGNLVKDACDIEKGIEFASSIGGIDGVIIIVGDKMGIWGDIKLSRW